MLFKIIVILVISLGIMVTTCKAQDTERWSFDGYYKNFSVAYQLKEDLDPLPNREYSVLGAISNRMRLNLKLVPVDGLTLETSYNIAPRVQDQILYIYNPSFSTIDPFAYRIDDLRSRFYPDNINEVHSFALYQNLDRAQATISVKFADFIIGRQAIAWGTAHVINPTDILAPYSFEELDTEDRIGIDAVRMRKPLGFMGEIDAGYVFGKDAEWKNSAAFLRVKYYLWQTDFSVLGLAFRENLLLGFDLARSIGGAGFWLETAYVLDNALNDDSNMHAENDYLRLSTGLDYNFGGSTYGFVEYHYNQAGETDSENYYRIMDRTAYREGSVYLLGEHYLIPGISYQLTGLVTVSGQLMTNLTDPSAYFMPQVEYNVAQNIYLEGGTFVGVGKPTKVSYTAGVFPQVEFRSEFGSYSNIYFVSFRYYF